MIDKEIHTIKVNIYGMELILRSQDDPGHLKRLAAMVDEQMRALSKQTKAISTTNLAILVALNIADEFAKYKSSAETRTKTAADKVENVLRLIEKVESN